MDATEGDAKRWPMKEIFDKDAFYEFDFSGPLLNGDSSGKLRLTGQELMNLEALIKA